VGEATAQQEDPEGNLEQATGHGQGDADRHPQDLQGCPQPEHRIADDALHGEPPGRQAIPEEGTAKQDDSHRQAEHGHLERHVVLGAQGRRESGVRPGAAATGTSTSTATTTRANRVAPHGRRGMPWPRFGRAGLGALTMRSLAEALGVKPMSLYHHVANKDAVLDALIDAVIGCLPLAEASWRASRRS